MQGVAVGTMQGLVKDPFYRDPRNYPYIGRGELENRHLVLFFKGDG